MGKSAGKDPVKAARTAANRERRIARDAGRKALCARARSQGHTHAISRAIRKIRRAAGGAA